MNLNNLEKLNICYNELYTTDDVFRQFLENIQPGWENCQFILLAGDCDTDIDLDGWDLHIFVGVYSATSPYADINDDGIIDSNDVARFAQAFGQI